MRRLLSLLLVVLPAAARAQNPVPPGAVAPPPEQPPAAEEPKKAKDLAPLMVTAGLGYAAFVFNQSKSDTDPSTAVATPGLAMHVEVGPRLGKDSPIGVVAAAGFAIASADVLSNYTAGAAMLALGARYDEGDGLRATLGLGAGGILMRRVTGDQKAISLAPFFHVDYPPPLFPPWLQLQGTFSYLPVPSPIRAFVASVGIGFVR